MPLTNSPSGRPRPPRRRWWVPRHPSPRTWAWIVHSTTGMLVCLGLVLAVGAYFQVRDEARSSGRGIGAVLLDLRADRDAAVSRDDPDGAVSRDGDRTARSGWRFPFLTGAPAPHEGVPLRAEGAGALSPAEWLEAMADVPQVSPEEYAATTPQAEAAAEAQTTAPAPLAGAVEPQVTALGTPAAPGTVKPGPGNTGVPAGTALTRHDGDLRITRAGTVLDAMDIRGFVTVDAPNVRITRSVVRGGTATDVQGVVTVTPRGSLVIEDSEVYPSVPSVKLDGIKGASFTARRVHVHGGVDNIKVHGDDVLIESSYLHGQQHFASDPLQDGGPTHNDGIQVLGGDNIRIVGNTVVSAAGLNAAVQVTQDFAPLTRAVISQNWLDGGGCTLNVNHKKLDDLTGLAVHHNRFGRATGYSDCAIITTHRVGLDLRANAYTDGKPVVVKTM